MSASEHTKNRMPVKVVVSDQAHLKQDGSAVRQDGDVSWVSALEVLKQLGNSIMTVMTVWPQGVKKIRQTLAQLGVAKKKKGSQTGNAALTLFC